MKLRLSQHLNSCRLSEQERGNWICTAGYATGTFHLLANCLTLAYKLRPPPWRERIKEPANSLHTWWTLCTINSRRDPLNKSKALQFAKSVINKNHRSGFICLIFWGPIFAWSLPRSRDVRGANIWSSTKRTLTLFPIDTGSWRIIKTLRTNKCPQ